MSLLDPRFKYTPAINTDVLETFRRFGFKPTSEEERQARQAHLDPRAHKSSRTPIPRPAGGRMNSNALG